MRDGRSSASVAGAFMGLWGGAVESSTAARRYPSPNVEPRLESKYPRSVEVPACIKTQRCHVARCEPRCRRIRRGGLASSRGERRLAARYDQAAPESPIELAARRAERTRDDVGREGNAFRWLARGPRACASLRRPTRVDATMQTIPSGLREQGRPGASWRCTVRVRRWCRRDLSHPLSPLARSDPRSGRHRAGTTNRRPVLARRAGDSGCDPFSGALRMSRSQ